MKILHISDFHIVSKDTLQHAIRFQEKLKSMGIDFPLTISSGSGQSHFLEYLKTYASGAFDAIVFSGDATSLGDKASLAEAKSFLVKIEEISLKRDAPKTNCVAIPGNHDVLDLGIRALLKQFDEQTGLLGAFLLKFIKGGKVEEFRNALREFLDKIGSPQSEGDADTSFRTLLRSRFMQHFDPYTSFPIGDELLSRTIDGKTTGGDNIRVNIFPLNTVPTRPHFVNMGMVTDEHLVNIVNRANLMKQSTDSREVVNFSVSHHGLMALSAESVAASDGADINLTSFLEHAISSQINGFKLGKALQSAGYDAHLHGHEHQNSLIRYDFDVESYGSIYSSGVDAAYDSNVHEFAFSIIELPNPFCMAIKAFRYEKVNSRFRWTQSDVVFDPPKSPKSTELAKKEIREFYYTKGSVDDEAVVSKDRFAAACDDLLLRSQKDIFVFGVRLDTLREKLLRITGLPEFTTKCELLTGRLKNRGIDILIVKPMREEKSYVLYDDKAVTSDLEKLKDEWGFFFRQLARNTNMSEDTIRTQFRIRFTNTPLTHAGTCESVRPSGDLKLPPRFSRALIQTIKIVRAYDSEVFLDLSYRTNNGLLRYFAGSAWNLWREAGDSKQELT